MKQEAVVQFAQTYLSLIAMGVFMSMFLAQVVSVFRKSRSAEFELMKRMPLEEDHR